MMEKIQKGKTNEVVEIIVFSKEIQERILNPRFKSFEDKITKRCQDPKIAKQGHSYSCSSLLLRLLSILHFTWGTAKHV